MSEQAIAAGRNMHYEGQHGAEEPADTAARLALVAEIARLTAALKKANDQAEHFERAWYLRGDVLEDVAISLKTCAWALRRGTAPELGERSLELLKRHGLLGSPLRGEARPGFDTLPDDYEAGHGA